MPPHWAHIRTTDTIVHNITLFFSVLESPLSSFFLYINPVAPTRLKIISQMEKALYFAHGQTEFTKPSGCGLELTSKLMTESQSYVCCMLTLAPFLTPVCPLFNFTGQKAGHLASGARLTKGQPVPAPLTQRHLSWLRLSFSTRNMQHKTFMQA